MIPLGLFDNKYVQRYKIILKQSMFTLFFLAFYTKNCLHRLFSYLCLCSYEVKMNTRRALTADEYCTEKLPSRFFMK